MTKRWRVRVTRVERVVLNTWVEVEADDEDGALEAAEIAASGARWWVCDRFDGEFPEADPDDVEALGDVGERVPS